MLKVKLLILSLLIGVLSFGQTYTPVQGNKYYKGFSKFAKKVTVEDTLRIGAKGIKYADGTIGTTGFQSGDTVQLSTLAPMLEDSTDTYATPTQVRSLITSLASLDSIATGTSDTACDGNIYLNTTSNQIRYRKGFYWYGLSKSDSTILFGSELITNGGFADGTGWYLGDNANQSITGGKLVLSDTSGWCSYYAVQNYLNLLQGHTYRFSLTVSDYYTGQLVIKVDNNDSGQEINTTPWITANGSYSYDITITKATSYTKLRFSEPCGGQCVLKIDDVSVKEILY